ncbi:MAG: thioredoxin family protein [Spirochaetales bacterium]|nr:thioredoxin family protein [Spirochaetales bacterium]
MLDNNTKKEVKKQFESLKNRVNLIVFTQEMECRFCEDTRKITEELATLSDKITVTIYDLLKDKEKADEFNVDKIPAIVVAGEDKKDTGVRFFGVPAGYEFASLLESIKLISTKNIGLSDETKKYLNTLAKKVHIQVFVTPTCPYCPMAVILAHKLAAFSENIKADMVEITEFPEMAVKYSVQGVPRSVINETFSQVGAAPEPLLLEKIKEALK